MPNYLAPGVYIEEISTGSRPIEPVGTNIAGLIGRAPANERHVDEPMWFDNWTQFRNAFATATEGGAGTPLASTPLSHAVYGFFLNGGSRCCVVNVGGSDTIAGDGTPRKGLGIFEQSDVISIVAAPGYTDGASYEALLSHCEKLQNRVAILDAPAEVPNAGALTKVATSEATARRRRATAAEGEPPAGEPLGYKPRQSDRGFGAFYFPHITVRDPLSPKDLVDVPPSGHIAGIYARTDTLRGVHKAPANEVIRGALNVTYRVTRQEQEQLNPEGVNCIRLFPREGIRVYGARTLAPSASEWRYLNVRRLFNMIEESIARSTRWVVFEPNDHTLWKSIRRDVSAFLTLIWRQGALMGRTPEEAFFVQCDEETNPAEVIDAGQVVVMIGIAPVKPAEFVIFRIGQGVAGTEIETAA
ncbi:MAG: phage tail sheath subtilisin-like domain-containing protein [Verrucomicrobiales bacterium]|nr:phage tail sheath subtilisin-like domain-containing protein [Verrucomicrobiales bacterium]